MDPHVVPHLGQTLPFAQQDGAWWGAERVSRVQQNLAAVRMIQTVPGLGSLLGGGGLAHGLGTGQRDGGHPLRQVVDEVVDQTPSIEFIR
jgi:hypothetical protein